MLQNYVIEYVRSSGCAGLCPAKTCTGLCLLHAPPTTSTSQQQCQVGQINLSWAGV